MTRKKCLKNAVPHTKSAVPHRVSRDIGHQKRPGSATGIRRNEKNPRRKSGVQNRVTSECVLRNEPGISVTRDQESLTRDQESLTRDQDSVTRDISTKLESAMRLSASDEELEEVKDNDKAVESEVYNFAMLGRPRSPSTKPVLGVVTPIRRETKPSPTSSPNFGDISTITSETPPRSRLSSQSSRFKQSQARIAAQYDQLVSSCECGMRFL